jgi:hypothetical protein
MFVDGRSRGQEMDDSVYKPVQVDTLPDLRRPEISDLPEAEAIRLAQQGNASAFECIYRLHRRRAYNLCLRMVGNSTAAEDLTQDIFLHCSEYLKRPQKIAPRTLHRLSKFSESSAGAAHLVRATVFDSCRFIEQSRCGPTGVT